MTGKPLKLRAEDAEDVQVISAVLQDAIVPVCDMVFQPESNSFVMVAQRLCRETDARAPDPCKAERVCSALTIKGVADVKLRGIDRENPEQMLDLLALLLDDEKSLTLVFAGDARIRLSLTSWKAALEDFGEPWPALCSPCHEGTVK